MSKKDDVQWVHEKDYGEFDLGGMISGIWYLTTGIIQLIIYAFKKDKND